MRAGDRVGKYVLETRIALGGMAEVWAARAEGPERFVKPVALKFILPAYSQDPDYGELFFNEARLAAQLQHGNLVSIIDFDRIPDDAPSDLAGRYYIAMERVDGYDLATVTKRAAERGTSLPVDLAVFVMGQVLEGLRYLQAPARQGRQQGFVHRDLSPQNVLLSFSGEVKISDFGIAKAASSRTTMNGLIRGKLQYFAPEQLSGGKATDKSDQFSAGVVLWELLSGRALFGGANEAEILDKVRRCEVDAPGAPGRPVSETLARVVLRMLAAKPEARFGSATEAHQALMDAAAPRAGAAHRLGDLLSELFPLPARVPVLVDRSSDSTAVIPAIARIEGQELRRIARQPEKPSGGRYSPVSGTKVLDPRPDDTIPDPPPRVRLAPIPRRFAGQRHDPEFPIRRMSELFDVAVARFEAAVDAGEFHGTFDDWQARFAERGFDAISGRPLPADWSQVAKWPRFTDVGWERALSFNWHGTIPWGRDGYWIAEDPIADEMMVVHAGDLGRDEFADITRGQWESWWRAREVDPRTEMPDGTRLPMSRRARQLLGQDAPPPRTKKEWYKAQEARERDAVRISSTLEKVTSPEQTLRPSVWQKLVRVAFGGKPDEGKKP